MSLTRLVLRFAAPIPQVEQYERYLFVGPHPDDIEIGAGATAAKLAAAGKAVCFLICTDGRYGDEHAQASGDALAARRRDEAVRAAARLGIHDVRFLDFCDGGFYSQEALRSAIAQVIGDFQPDVLLAPDPFVSSECHIDHLNVGQAVRHLAPAAPNRGIMDAYGAKAAPVQAVAFFMTARPNRYVRTSGFMRRQIDTLLTGFPSQFPEGDPGISGIILYLRIRAFAFGLRSLKGCAEGFRVLGALHMHCLPESGSP